MELFPVPKARNNPRLASHLNATQLKTEGLGCRRLGLIPGRGVPDVDAIKPDTEPGLEKWLSLNAEDAKIWPNITVKKAPPLDYKVVGGEAGQTPILLNKSRRRSIEAPSTWRGNGGGSAQLIRPSAAAVAMIAVPSMASPALSGRGSTREASNMTEAL
jgi:hypothetical protein